MYVARDGLLDRFACMNLRIIGRICSYTLYCLQEKLVNFMAPQPQEAPAMASQLFRNLFGHSPGDTEA